MAFVDEEAHLDLGGQKPQPKPPFDSEAWLQPNASKSMSRGKSREKDGGRVCSGGSIG